MISSGVLLLDTHVWIWWIEQDGRLPRLLTEAIENFDGVVAVSTATIYETIILARRKRIELNRDIGDWIEHATRGADVGVLPLDSNIAQQAGNLPLHHSDPLNRLIIASAILHDAQLASADSKFPAYAALGGRLISGRI
jgi:PIN domain nuclease of toxin-antitoxin system